jgi:hypothetical protein
LTHTGDGVPDDALATPSPESDPEWLGSWSTCSARAASISIGYKVASLRDAYASEWSRLEVEIVCGLSGVSRGHPNEFATLFNNHPHQCHQLLQRPGDMGGGACSRHPEILAAKAPAEPLRAWSVGCATGEEAYTIAMILG